MSKGALWAMRTLSSQKWWNAISACDRLGAPDTAASSMPWIFVEAGGIGRPGATSISNRSPVRRPRTSRRPAICTIRSEGSSPVVSVSKTTQVRSDSRVEPSPRLGRPKS